MFTIKFYNIFTKHNSTSVRLYYNWSMLKTALFLLKLIYVTLYDYFKTLRDMDFKRYKIVCKLGLESPIITDI